MSIYVLGYIPVDKITKLFIFRNEISDEAKAVLKAFDEVRKEEKKMMKIVLQEVDAKSMKDMTKLAKDVSKATKYPLDDHVALYEVMLNRGDLKRNDYPEVLRIGFETPTLELRKARRRFQKNVFFHQLLQISDSKRAVRYIGKEFFTTKFTLFEMAGQGKKIKIIAKNTPFLKRIIDDSVIMKEISNDLTVDDVSPAPVGYTIKTSELRETADFFIDGVDDLDIYFDVREHRNSVFYFSTLSGFSPPLPRLIKEFDPEKKDFVTIINPSVEYDFDREFMITRHENFEHLINRRKAVASLPQYIDTYLEYKDNSYLYYVLHTGENNILISKVNFHTQYGLRNRDSSILKNSEVQLTIEEMNILREGKVDSEKIFKKVKTLYPSVKSPKFAVSEGNVLVDQILFLVPMHKMIKFVTSDIQKFADYSRAFEWKYQSLVNAVYKTVYKPLSTRDMSRLKTVAESYKKVFLLLEKYASAVKEFQNRRTLKKKLLEQVTAEGNKMDDVTTQKGIFENLKTVLNRCQDDIIKLELRVNDKQELLDKELLKLKKIEEREITAEDIERWHQKKN